MSCQFSILGQLDFAASSQQCQRTKIESRDYSGGKSSDVKMQLNQGKTML
jgi:hypothetical protein